MPAPLLQRAARLLTRPVGVLTERLGSRFYFMLAAIVAAAVVAALAMDLNVGMKAQVYDLVMRSRFRSPPPDPRITLIDIDEASLAAMAPEYGRWPWPRSVIAELIEGLARARPAAIVFDVVFADLDRAHPEADQYLREVAARYPDTFFAMIRLAPANDALSELELAQLAGVTALADAMPGATAAMVVPYFFDVLSGRRLGTINLTADEDGIARSYHVYQDAHGYRIHSLPANVVAALGGELPQQPDILLNWRGRPPAYRSVSFHRLYERLLSSEGAAPREFAGQIAIVGSTAPALFDIRPTPVSREHTGLEILATALDNLKNGDHLRELPAALYALISAAAVLLLAVAFRSNVDAIWLRAVFTVMQFAFLALTYLFLNYTRWFVDLTAPFTAAFAYFIVAGLYDRALVLRRNGHPWFSSALDPGCTAQVLLAVCRIEAPPPRRARIHRLLQRQSGLTHHGAAAPQLFAAAPLLEKLHEDVALFYWLVPPAKACVALGDLFGMLERSFRALDEAHRASDLRIALHATRLKVAAEGNWEAQGKEAFIDALQLAQQSAEGPIVMSEAFSEMCKACSQVEVPASLARAGFACMAVREG